MIGDVGKIVSLFKKDHAGKAPLPFYTIHPERMSQTRYALAAKNRLKPAHSHAFPGTISAPWAEISAPNRIRTQFSKINDHG